TADVTDDLAATSRVADVDGVRQVERLDQRSEIVGIRVEVVAVPRLARTTVPAAMVRNAAEAVRRKVVHLILERLRAERPAVAEDHRLPASPVVVVDLRPILRCDRAHPWSPFLRMRRFVRRLCDRVLARQCRASRRTAPRERSAARARWS